MDLIKQLAKDIIVKSNEKIENADQIRDKMLVLCQNMLKVWGALGKFVKRQIEVNEKAVDLAICEESISIGKLFKNKSTGQIELSISE